MDLNHNSRNQSPLFPFLNKSLQNTHYHTWNLQIPKLIQPKFINLNLNFFLTEFSKFFLNFNPLFRVKFILRILGVEFWIPFFIFQSIFLD